MPSAIVAHTLLDHNLPRRLAGLLHGHVVRTAAQEGWEQLANGTLMKVAESAGFEVFVTGDKNLSYQNNLKNRSLSLIILSETAWPVLKNHAAVIRAAIDAAVPGSYREVKLPRPVKNSQLP